MNHYPKFYFGQKVEVIGGFYRNTFATIYAWRLKGFFSPVEVIYQVKTKEGWYRDEIKEIHLRAVELEERAVK